MVTERQKLIVEALREEGRRERAAKLVRRTHQFVDNGQPLDERCICGAPRSNKVHAVQSTGDT